MRGSRCGVDRREVCHVGRLEIQGAEATLVLRFAKVLVYSI